MNKLLRFSPVILALFVTVSAVPAAGTGKSTDGMQSFSKNAVVGAKEIKFSQEDFTSGLSKNMPLEGVVITGLPDSTAGVVRVGDRDIMTGEAVVSERLSELRFVPSSPNELVETGLTFLPVYKNGAGAENVTVSINVLNLKNNPPKAESITLSTYKNVALIGTFEAVDPEGDALEFKIVKEPKKGTVTISDDSGKFEYTPNKNKTGSDSFMYVAVDKYGNLSEPAAVEIRIEKSKTNTVYADMAKNPSHYAAIKMADKDVFVGEKIGDSLFFHPDKTVTRGEFVAMTVAMLGMDNIPVSRTGFADDDVTPTWVKPYMSTALKAGIIKGVTTSDGRKVFLAEAPISRAEAAVIINNAINLADNLPTSMFADEDAIPSWAAQATINVASKGIISGYGDGTLRPDEAVTRMQTAKLLCAALEVKEAQEAQGGLLGWAKR